MDKQTLYIAYNKSRPFEVKFGIFRNDRIERILDSHEQFSYSSEYLKLYDLESTPEYKLNLPDFDKIISYSIHDEFTQNLDYCYSTRFAKLRLLSRCVLKNGGGTELCKYNNLDKLVDFIENELEKTGIKIVKKFEQWEIDMINKTIKRNNLGKKSCETYESFRNNIIFVNTPKSNRDYQNEAIDYCSQKLISEGKIYLDLATGAGKSFITFEIMSLLKPFLIICFSPRTKINSQNLGKKYLAKLNNEYTPINFSQVNKQKILIDGKYIITCCTQSYEDLYGYLEANRFLSGNRKIFIWFDEAHWAIENWKGKSDISNFFLTNERISYRFFTSASPDPNVVLNNKDIFGEFYQPIKVKELIEQGWLCPIKPYIFETREEDKINLIEYILKNFRVLGRKSGLSFQNKDENAFEMFMLHLERYNSKKTDIKPFLIIDQTSHHYKKIAFRSFDYDFNKLEEFEKFDNSIAYVVKKLDMGYDNAKIDYVVFSDPKLSYKDIIQCIGRGTRPDCLGENGKNKDKNLAVMLPVFVDELEDKNRFTEIINVLRYLIEDIGLDITEKIVSKNCDNETISGSETSKVDYIGTDIIAAKLLDSLGYSINKEKLISLLKKNIIVSEKSYINFKENNKHLKLRDNIYDYRGFKWKDVVDSSKYYPNFVDCENAMNKYKKELAANSEDIKLKELKKFSAEDWNEIDSKIPPFDKPEEYYYS